MDIIIAGIHRHHFQKINRYRILKQTRQYQLSRDMIRRRSGEAARHQERSKKKKRLFCFRFSVPYSYNFSFEFSTTVQEHKFYIS